jgi:hypothetical protein
VYGISAGSPGQGGANASLPGAAPQTPPRGGWVPRPAAGDDHSPASILKKIRVSIELRRAVAALHKATANLSEKENARRANKNTELSSEKRSAEMAARVQALRANRRVVKAAVAFVKVEYGQ